MKINRKALAVLAASGMVLAVGGFFLVAQSQATQQRPAQRYLRKAALPVSIIGEVSPETKKLSLDLEATQSGPAAVKILDLLMLSGEGRREIQKDYRRRSEECDQPATTSMSPCLDSKPGGTADIKLEVVELQKLSDENPRNELPFLLEVSKDPTTPKAVREEVTQRLEQILSDPGTRKYYFRYLDSRPDI